MISGYICLSGLGNGFLVSKNRVETICLVKAKGSRVPATKTNSYSTLP